MPPESPPQQSSEKDADGEVVTLSEPTDQHGNGTDANDRKGEEDGDEQVPNPNNEATREPEETNPASAGKPPSGSRTSLTASTKKRRSSESLRSRSGSSLKNSKSKESRETFPSSSSAQAIEQKTEDISNCENSSSVANAETIQYGETEAERPKDAPSSPAKFEPSTSPTRSHHHSSEENKENAETADSTPFLLVQDETLRQSTSNAKKTSSDDQQKPPSASSRSSARGSRVKLVSRSGSSSKGHPVDDIASNPSSPVDKRTGQSQTSLFETVRQEDERLEEEGTA